MFALIAHLVRKLQTKPCSGGGHIGFGHYDDPQCFWLRYRFLNISILNILSTSENLQLQRFKRQSMWSFKKRAWSFSAISPRIEPQSQFLRCSLGSYQPRTVEIFSPKLSAYISQPGPVLKQADVGRMDFLAKSMKDQLAAKTRSEPGI